jgi:FtsP/CotA-like multicopper oxidase with cupredoxin domain
VIDRRSFLEAGAGTALLCSLGKPLSEATVRDADRADAAAARIARPAEAARPQARSFPKPRPAPGGRVREYWIQARAVRWSLAPHPREQWMKHRIRGRRTFRAFIYQRMSEGFAEPIGPARIPGPTLHAEVGDLLQVNVRNAGERFAQAITMHPHGVFYNPDYDGSYLGDFTRAGGFIAPGEEFTYRWECVPGSEGAWPYHDHGPNHTLNTVRGLFGAIVVRPRGAPRPDREFVLFLHSFPPAVTGRLDTVQCINGRVGAGNTPTLRARVGDDVAFHLFGGDGNFHTFHIHGHRWADPAGRPTDNPSFGPHETALARFREDNPGRWLYHCHVFSHQDAGMAGWYLVDP